MSEELDSKFQPFVEKLEIIQNDLGVLKQTVNVIQYNLETLWETINVVQNFPEHKPSKARRGTKRGKVSKNLYRPDMKVPIAESFSDLHELNKRVISLIAHR